MPVHPAEQNSVTWLAASQFRGSDERPPRVRYSSLAAGDAAATIRFWFAVTVSNAADVAKMQNWTAHLRAGCRSNVTVPASERRLPKPRVKAGVPTATSMSTCPDGTETYARVPACVVTTAANEAYFDGDGDLDLASASSEDDAIVWYVNTDANGAFGPHQVVATAANEAYSVFAADIDGDGDSPSPSRPPTLCW